MCGSNDRSDVMIMNQDTQRGKGKRNNGLVWLWNERSGYCRGGATESNGNGGQESKIKTSRWKV